MVYCALDCNSFFSEAALSEVYRAKTEFYFEYFIYKDVLISDTDGAIRFKLPQTLKSASVIIEGMIKEQAVGYEGMQAIKKLKTFIRGKKIKIHLTIPLKEEKILQLDLQKLKQTDSILCILRLENFDQTACKIRDELSGLIPQHSARKILTKKIRNDFRSKADLLVFDIDNLKQINDTYGHPVGDKAIRTTALKIQELLEPGDLACRLGGDEFAVLRTGRKFSYDEILSFLSLKRIYIEQMYVGVSMGRASGTERSFEDLYREADTNMYIAKEKNRNRLPSLDIIRNTYRQIQKHPNA